MFESPSVADLTLARCANGLHAALVGWHGSHAGAGTPFGRWLTADAIIQGFNPADQAHAAAILQPMAADPSTCGFALVHASLAAIALRRPLMVAGDGSGGASAAEREIVSGETRTESAVSRTRSNRSVS